MQNDIWHTLTNVSQRWLVREPLDRYSVLSDRLVGNCIGIGTLVYKQS